MGKKEAESNVIKEEEEAEEEEGGDEDREEEETGQEEVELGSHIRVAKMPITRAPAAIQNH